MRQDPSVTVTFPMRGSRAAELGLEGVRALAWTTTPWTLPTNAALAVGPAIEYAVVAGYLLAKDLVGNYAKDLGYASADEARDAVERTVLGADLENVEYEPIFDYSVSYTHLDVYKRQVGEQREVLKHHRHTATPQFAQVFRVAADDLFAEHGD